MITDFTFKAGRWSSWLSKGFLARFGNRSFTLEKVTPNNTKNHCLKGSYSNTNRWRCFKMSCSVSGELSGYGTPLFLSHISVAIIVSISINSPPCHSDALEWAWPWLLSWNGLTWALVESRWEYPGWTVSRLLIPWLERLALAVRKPAWWPTCKTKQRADWRVAIEKGTPNNTQIPI